MKSPIVLLTAILSAGTLLAEEPNPEMVNRIRAEKERIMHLQKAAENLQAAGMNDQAEELRARARRAAEELEQLGARREGDRERPQRPEGGRPRDGEGERPQGDRPQGDRERPGRPAGDRPDPAPQLQAQIEELRMMVRRLTERLERLEVALREQREQPR